ncbi:hypothetical protein [Mycoplasmopsis cricetuli]|uniref:hypothetical protein n=1 Tax=Mycoplasmopsis cricetuli TaxID=171283 RepID=UPI000471474D|nr:hypothetical protein [Mycoplasmopsis cricetuli]
MLKIKNNFFKLKIENKTLKTVVLIVFILTLLTLIIAGFILLAKGIPTYILRISEVVIDPEIESINPANYNYGIFLLISATIIAFIFPFWIISNYDFKRNKNIKNN